jgi:glyoxylase-like metal-dependent hydrolase (beta-lactamase superfamily II)
MNATSNGQADTLIARPVSLFTAQVPGLQHRKVGKAVVTAVLDGYIDLLADYWVNFPRNEQAQGLAKAFLDPHKPIRISINAYLINTGDRLIAIDTGADTFFGSPAGDYQKNLSALGVKPEWVDTVLLTHLHPDHFGGLIAGGKTVFPNAELVISSLEHNYWMSDASKAAAPDFAKPWFDGVNRLTKAYADRLRFFEGEQEVLPGIQSVSLYGHTPGHSGFLFSSGGEQLFFWADTTDQTALQLNHPERTLIFDVNQEDGSKARKKAIQLAASQRLLVAGSHVPFPGLGYIDQTTADYTFVPAEWQYEL